MKCDEMLSLLWDAVAAFPTTERWTISNNLGIFSFAIDSSEENFLQKKNWKIELFYPWFFIPAREARCMSERADVDSESRSCVEVMPFILHGWHTWQANISNVQLIANATERERKKDGSVWLRPTPKKPPRAGKSTFRQTIGLHPWSNEECEKGEKNIRK